LEKAGMVGYVIQIQIDILELEDEVDIMEDELGD
jgi:ribosomal protein S28E/S33